MAWLVERTIHTVAVSEAEAASTQIGKHVADVANCHKEQQEMRRKLADATEQLGTVSGLATEVQSKQARLEAAVDNASRSVSTLDVQLQSLAPKVAPTTAPIA